MFSPPKPATAGARFVRSSYHADEQSAKYTGEEHLNTNPTLASA